MFRFARVVISPATNTIPVFVAVSAPTLDCGSCLKHSSKIASETMSQTLSGCPSVTLSDVNK